METRYEEVADDLVARLRKCMVSAPTEFPVHPTICDEAAAFIEKTLAALREFGDAYESELREPPFGEEKTGN